MVCVFKNQVYNLNLDRVNSNMFCEVVHLAVSFAAFVAPERLFPTVRPHVALQVTRRSTGVVALVALVGFFSCMLPHRVNFQITSCNAGKLAHFASVRLFPSVSPFVLLQIA